MVAASWTLLLPVHMRDLNQKSQGEMKGAQNKGGDTSGLASGCHHQGPLALPHCSEHILKGEWQAGACFS